MKIKHSKFKNTGILFELLVRQIASDTVSNKDSAAIGLVKKHFSKSELAKEYKLYQTLVSPKSLSEAKAETFINSTLDTSLRLNKTALRKEKYNLIKEIKEHYDLEEFFKAKIHNYKAYAAIYNLIEVHTSLEFIEPSFIVENKVTLLEFLTQQDVNKNKIEDQVMLEYASQDKATRELISKIMIDKFNEKYANLCKAYKILAQSNGIAPAGPLDNTTKDFGVWEKEKLFGVKTAREHSVKNFVFSCL
jgi:hypothetical protein